MNDNRAGKDFEKFTIADRLRKAREHTGLSQREFAKMTGISHGTVGSYETNPNFPHKLPYLLAWAVGSGFALEWLLTGQGPARPQPGTSPFPAMLTDSDRSRSLQLVPRHVPSEWLEADADLAMA
jgi:transcriptional regulator with XRE-family HTH domain